MTEEASMNAEVFERCRAALPGWRDLTPDQFEFDNPKGFSSFTMGVRSKVPADPPAVLYRHLDGKENAILDFATERDTFLLLGRNEIAAPCLHYDDICRIEEFYRGRTLTAADVFDPEIQRGIANELHRFHQLEPDGLPPSTFFELVHGQWGEMARHVLGDGRTAFPASERALCDDLAAIHHPETLEKVLGCLPDGPPVFCHNDTYHGNVFLLDDGTVKLLDFEFSCLNHAAFDFANLFAETVMEHGFADPPHFRIAEPRFADTDLAAFIGFYLDNEELGSEAHRAAEQTRLVAETRRAIMASDFMYAMAALPLALQPIQKIRFIPYAHQRFHKFLRSWDAEFGSLS
ncbi:MAG: phosphotransferase [Actinomycetia bacterium]|nr:phosphotransferase [Actinomycetes bacterium]MCP4084018.1 phosphotransferase [Actinomycetes bacterium]